MTRALGRLAAMAGAVVALLLAAPAAANAHPLGNFTVNRYSGLVVGPDRVSVDHVLDLAEIPTVERMQVIDRDGDGRASPDELRTYAAAACRIAARRIGLEVAGHPVRLAVHRAAAWTRTGQAGLPTLRVECDLRARIAPLAGTVEVRFRDRDAGDGIGWREVTAQGDGTTLTRSDVPRQSPSARLTTYPRDLLASPLDVRAARLQVRPGGALLRPATAAAGTPQTAVGGRLTAVFQGLVTGYDGSLPLAAVALLAATLLGAAHAVAPGHGKTVMAFYLSSRRDRALRSAATVGATVTATHTAGVLLLGLFVSAGTAFAPARLYPVLTTVSGVLVVAVGVTLLRGSRHGHTHPHPHDHGMVADPDADTEAHPHGPPSRGGLVAMGVAGGLLPSPSALVVFLGALALGHAWFGVLLVVCFGLGMALTLVAVGLVVRRMRSTAEHRFGLGAGSRAAAVVRRLPALTAAGVVVLGLAAALKGVAAIGG